jgi:hypothetical protein
VKGILFLIWQQKSTKSLALEKARQTLQGSATAIKNNFTALKNESESLALQTGVDQDKIIKVYNYYEKNPDKYTEMVKSGYSKVKKIKETVVYDSIYKIIKRYSKEQSSQN